MNNIEELAEKNLQALRQNPYPGRGFVIGKNDKGEVVIIYWIMGRSEASRNRVFEIDEKRVSTAVADSTKPSGDPELVFYNAMDIIGDTHIVSNGKQTGAIRKGIDHDDRLQEIMDDWDHEPDKPNFTPRISAIVTMGLRPLIEISIIRKALKGEGCDRLYFYYDDLPNGFGRCLTTYSGDGDPLPSFTGEPFLVPVTGQNARTGEAFWYALNEANRVALACKVITLSNQPQVHLINKYNKV